MISVEYYSESMDFDQSQNILKIKVSTAKKCRICEMKFANKEELDVHLSYLHSSFSDLVENKVSQTKSMPENPQCYPTTANLGGNA